MYQNDTIAAIATAPGIGGIGIIRLSGDKSINIVDKIFVSSKGKTLSNTRSHSVIHGKIIDPANKTVLDEVLVVVMKKPNTYTREDVVEIDCHGGTVQVKSILELLLRNDIRLAEPGEFTKRAFLNGRIDLVQAEAVIDLIQAKTELSAKAAMNSLEGKISIKIKRAKDLLITLIAKIEVTVDYPEEDIEEIAGEEVYVSLSSIRKELNKIIEDSESGKILREGLKVAIAGKPNVGKSSLMNEFTGENRAIVTEIAGTTRDIIEEYISIKGIPIRIIDTAGIRETEDIVEKIGVQKAEKTLYDADVVLFMIDGDNETDKEDLELAQKLKGRNVIIVVNKIDLGVKADIELVKKILEDSGVIYISAKESMGIDSLRQKLIERFFSGDMEAGGEDMITNIRHINLLREAVRNIEDAEAAYENQMPLDCMTIDIMNAAEKLGQITGESIKEDILNEIFHKFCIGK